MHFSDSAPTLMKYSATVRDVAAKNAHWRCYDENFCYVRQKSLFRWDEIHWELWLQAHHMNRNSTQTPPMNIVSKQAKQPFPRRFCWNFTQEKDVLAVITSTIALNVEPHTRPLNVSQDALQPLHYALSRPTPPSTPVKLNKLQAYLGGYPAKSQHRQTKR